MDVVVVGAGIIGTAIAYEVAKAGASVTLLDRGPVGELGASRWGFGGVVWASARTPSTIEFSRRGFERYLQMDEELGIPCGFRRDEALTLLEHGVSVNAARTSVDEYQSSGYEVRLLTPDELKRLEPGLDLHGWAGAIGLGQGHLDLLQCINAWVQRGRQLGLRIREGVEVRAVRPQAGGSRLETSDGALHADTVFLAAGAWTRSLLRASSHDLPVFYSHAEFLFTDPLTPVLGHEISWAAHKRDEAESESVKEELLPDWSSGVDKELVPHSHETALVQYPDGHLRIGQLSRLIPALTPRIRPDSRELLLQGARRLLPSVDSLPGITLGRRPVTFTPDHLPMVGPLPGMPRAIVVATSTSPTILAPALAEAMADFVTRGNWDSALNEWRLARDVTAPAR